MGEVHLTEVLLESIFSGSEPPGRLLRRMIRHLADLCPTCRKEFERYAKKRASEGSQEPINFEILLHTVTHWSETIAILKDEAHRDLKELFRLAPAERYRRIDRALKRFRSPVLAELLLAKSREAIFTDSEESFHLADLAGKVTLCINVQLFGIRVPEELLTRVKANKANARRVAGHLAEASRLIRQPLEEIRNTADPLVVGEVLTYAAALRSDQHRFDEALAYLKEAAATYEEIGQRELAGRALILEADVFRLMGNPDVALETVTRAIDLLPVSPVTHLHLSAEHNHALYLLEVGRKDEARKAFEKAGPIYERFSAPAHQLHRRWLEGRIAESFGDLEAAEEAYQEVQAGLVTEGLGIDAALACLDRALLYVKLGEPSKIASLAHGIHTVLSAHGIHREALAALILFQNALLSQELEAKLVHRLKAYLERSRNNPELVFEKQPE